jgi:hypothetical protein
MTQRTWILIAAAVVILLLIFFFWGSGEPEVAEPVTDTGEAVEETVEDPVD